MNTPLRRVSLAVMVLVLLLLGQATWIQVVKADEYRADPRNARVLLDEYARQRGQISAGGEVLAQSVESPDPGDRLRFLRQYTDGPLYAPVTGYYSQIYGAGGMERAMDPVLNGTDDRLFVRRISDAVTGRDPAGGNVVLSIDPRIQRAAYEAMTSRNYQGAVVAIRPQTGEILAMVSTPSYDPNPLASHSGTTQQNAWNELTEDDPPTLTNRAISETYPPGSTFKIVNTAAALEAGMITPQTPVTAAPRITLPDSTTQLENYDGKPCGPGATVPFATAFAKSCNGPFAQLAVQVGADRLRGMATSLGFNNPALTVPMPVQASQVGDLDDGASVAQSGIGQRDVRLTPLQNAQIAATVANGGVPMTPQHRVPDPGPGPLDRRHHRARPAGPGVLAVHGGHPDPAHDRLGEQRLRGGQDPRRPDRLQDRHRRVGRRPEDQPPAHLVRRLRPGAEPADRGVGHRRARRQPRRGSHRRLGGRPDRPCGHRRRPGGDG